MKDLIDHLKGLYYYCKASKRIIVPLTKSEWVTLWSIAYSWKNDYPEPLQFGSYLALEPDAMRVIGMYNQIMEVIDYQYQTTVNALSVFSYFPLGHRKIIESTVYAKYYDTIGWKQEFEWRPTCG
jgi:hypothetical protein